MFHIVRSLHNRSKPVQTRKSGTNRFLVKNSAACATVKDSVPLSSYTKISITAQSQLKHENHERNRFVMTMDEEEGSTRSNGHNLSNSGEAQLLGDRQGKSIQQSPSQQLKGKEPTTQA
ncbi:hypothetical protein V6N13_067453 [Hibiscus sabdariffa]